MKGFWLQNVMQKLWNDLPLKIAGLDEAPAKAIIKNVW